MKQARSILKSHVITAMVVSMVGSAWAAAPNRNLTLPEATSGLVVDQKLDAEVPTELPFVDERGNAVTIQDYLGQGKPVLLSLVYYRCPMMCNLVLKGMAESLREVDLVPGRDFEIVTVSIDPREKPRLARQNKQTYLEAYGKVAGESGWHFLTGPATSSKTLADAVGFPFRYLESRDEYAHPAALILITPDGRVSHYLHGFSNEPRTVRLALIEASQGAIGSPLDQLLLYCYQYDETEGVYAPVAMRIMQLGGGMTVFVLGVVLFGFWRKEFRQKRLANAH